MEKILITIVSNSIEASLLPVLKTRAEFHLLLCTEKMQNKAERLKNLINSTLSDKMADIEIVDELPEDDVHKIAQFIDLLIKFAKTRWRGTQLWLNITGGNKLTVLGAYQAATGQVDKIIYTDKQFNRLQVINSRNNNNDPIALGSLMDVKTYLAANDKLLVPTLSSTDQHWQTRVKKRQEVTCWLGDNIPLLAHVDGPSFFNITSDLAAQTASGTSHFTSQQTLKEPLQGVSETALYKLNEAGVILWNSRNPAQIVFPSVEKAKYMCGGWLKEYLWLTASKLGISDVVIHAEFRNDNSDWTDSLNKMDLILCHNNRLLMIECRATADIEKKTDLQTNKLQMLSDDANELICDKLFVSVHPLNKNDVQPASSNNASFQRLEWTQVSQIKYWLSKWLSADDHTATVTF